MSEVTKLYENAGIEPKKCSECDNNMDCGFGKDCYPPFTAEKELKLIKWFMHSGHFCPIRFYIPWLVDDIASHINFLWEKLTEEEKKQIKEILNG